MRAILFSRYGSPDALKLHELAAPAPKDSEVLIRVRAASINSRDDRLLRANPFFLRFLSGGLLRPRPTILGVDVAGQVVAVGKDVTRFQPGDEVFGLCAGAFAEYACAEEADVAFKPANRSFEQAAAVPLAAMTALQALRDTGNLQPGQKVLIQGASGGVGSFAVQIAKCYGARVTAVCSARNLDRVRALGAERAIDYAREDCTRGDSRYDLILAVNGFHPISHYLRCLSPNGTYVVAGGALLQFFQAAIQSRGGPAGEGKKTAAVSLRKNPQDLAFLKDLLETGMILPAIDACYPLEQTAEAFRHYEKDHPRGKIVITVE